MSLLKQNVVIKAYALVNSLSRLRFVRGLVVPLLLAGVWEILSQQGAAYSYAFVPIGDILRGLPGLILSGDLLINLTATLARMSSGLLIGVTVGVLIASLMAMSRIVDKLISPLYHTIRQVPLLGWIPLIGLWFGNGEFSRILVIALAAFYPMVLNTYEGLRSVERKYGEVSQVFRLSPTQFYLQVAFPAALPSIFTGLSHALAFAWVTTVGSEILFSSGAGLGNLMVLAGQGSRMDVIVVCVVCIGILGFSLNYLFGLASQRLLKWRNTR